MPLTLITSQTKSADQNSISILNEFVKAFENLDLERLEQLIVNEDEKIGVQNKWQFLQSYKEHFEDLKADGLFKMSAFKHKCICYPDKIAVGFSSERFPKETAIIFSIDDGMVKCISWCNYMSFQQDKIDNSVPFFSTI